MFRFFLFFQIVEYDPNPLLSLNKRAKPRSASQTALDELTNNCFRIKDDPNELAIADQSEEAANR